MEAQRTLAELEAGEVCTIESFLSESIRWIGAQLGLPEGGTVRCRARGAKLLVLEDENGRTIIVEAETAQFIRIRVNPAASG